jgi:hypothetical protein
MPSKPVPPFKVVVANWFPPNHRQRTTLRHGLDDVEVVF